MEHQYTLYEKRGRIAYITMNRPEAMNAVHPPASRELAAIFNDFAADPEVWVAILTGAGDRAFCAGNDLKYAAGHLDENARPVPVNGGWGGFVLRFDLFKPVIAAVNGWAMGGGLEMALASDIIIASETARFGLPEPRVGDTASGGGLNRLPRQIPLKIAMGMILTGKPIDAKEAYRIGLVNEVVPQAELMPAAERWAGEILEGAPLAVRGSKETAMVGLDVALETAIRRSYGNVELHTASEDYAEGPTAFSEKRKPNWKGR